METLFTKKVSVVLRLLMADKEQLLLRIRQTAHDLFMQFGLKSVSMDDIASKMGVSKKTIYHHFADKESLVLEVLNEINRNNQEVSEANRKIAVDAVHEIYLSIHHMSELFDHINPSILFDLYKYYPKAYQAFDRYKNQDLLGVIKVNIKRGIKEEVFRSAIHVDIISRFRLESIVMPFSPEFQRNNKSDIFQISKELTEHYLHGIVTAKGLKLMAKYAKIKYSK